MDKNKTIITIVIAILCVMIFNVRVFAENTDTTTTGEEFSLSQERMDIILNSTLNMLSITGEYKNEVVIWESSDPTVATVEDGRITPLKIGTTTITATRGGKTASCEVNVIYRSIQINANQGWVGSSKVNLVLDEHETETLWAKVDDGKGEAVKDAKVEWTSSDSNIVEVEKNTGKLKGIKEGNARITATAAGVSEICEVTVYSAPEFTDFSGAKCEITLQDNVSNVVSNLRITGITPKDDSKNTYYFMITSNKTKPTLISNNRGWYDLDESGFIQMFTDSEGNCLEYCVDEYLELNQDLYLWVLEKVELDETYVNEDKNNISSAIKFCIEGEKLQRPEIKLDKTIDSMDLYDAYTNMSFNFPSNTENRKFSIKIGKVTNYEIIEKIRNNDYSGTTDLLEYSKSNEAIYTSNLTTTDKLNYFSKSALFELNKLLITDNYYYIYVMFDDENGKYYPIEGIRLAYYSDLGKDNKNVLYTIKDQWEDLTGTPTDEEENEAQPEDKNQGSVDSVEKNDQTTAGTKLPHTGAKTIIPVILIIILASIVSHKKMKKFKDII